MLTRSSHVDIPVFLVQFWGLLENLGDGALVFERDVVRAFDNLDLSAYGGCFMSGLMLGSPFSSGIGCTFS